MMPSPPKFALRFLRWYCEPKRLDYIEGDLIEVYLRRLTAIGKRKADLRFVVDVILLFRSGIIKSRKPQKQFYGMMFTNNFKIAARNLWKNKVITTINVAGLTAGITSCLLIALFISFELSFDRSQSNRERIARVIMEYSFDGGGAGDVQTGNFTSTKVAPVFSRTFPEVLKGIRMTDASMIVRLNDDPVTEANFLFADSSFFDAFDHEFIAGNPKTALNGPYKVVLTESTAKRYFGKQSAVGKLLLTGTDSKPYEVTGVMRDYPSNSQLRFDFLASFSSLGANQEESYFNANYRTYLLLTDKGAMASLQGKLHPFMEKEMKGSGASIKFYLERFDEIHLHSPYSAFVPNTSMSYLYILGGVAALIIVIVCFTYINLSTAKSIERAREVGIRKMSGAVRGQLFWQFISEATVLCGLSVAVSFVLAWIALPAFNQLIGRHLQLSDLMSPLFIVVAFSATALVSLIAGCYPALVLSRLQPVNVLKGVFKNSKPAKVLQQSLTVFQFAVSVFLIIVTIVIQSQLHFIQNQKLGYDRAHVISLPIGWSSDYSLIATLKNELKTNRHILNASRCASSPVNISSGYSMRLPTMLENQGITTNANPIDADYLNTAGLELIAGRGFTEQQVAQTAAKEGSKFYYILNEAAVKKLGFKSPDEAIGREMILNESGIITGVVKDFHFQTMRSSIDPLVLFTASWGNKLLIKLDGEDLTATLGFTERKLKQLLPGRPFEFSFLEDQYTRMYFSEMQLGKMMNLFAGIAIFLACLGLFGLSSYMIQQRTKEVGIRKVMGASVWNVFGILAVDFIRLVFASIVLAVPVAWLLMRQWLNGFAYRIDLEIWMFLVAGLTTLFIAASTVAFHGFRAATDNPVRSLKSE